MTKIYEIGGNGYWTGAAREIGDREGMPRGWTRSPLPALASGEYAAWGGGDWVVVNHPYTPPAPPPPTIEQLIAAVDAHVEGVAQSMDYKSAAHCAGYVTSTIPQWAAEAQAFVAWRDQVWLTAYSLDPENLPATVADALALLPVFVRPEL
jgi:hypothetical protein